MSCGRFVIFVNLLFVVPAFGLEPVAELSASDDLLGFNGFGSAVAVDGDVIAVGAPLDDELEKGLTHGAVYVFRRIGGHWFEEAKLFGSQAGWNDVFGSSVAIQGNLLVVGQPHSDPAGSDFGAAYVFRRNGATWVEARESDDHSANRWQR